MSRFNEIREKFHKEKNSPGLSEMPKDFYSKAMEEAKLLQEKAKHKFDSDTLREYESMMSMLRRLYWIRIQKIVMMALNSEEKPNMLLPEEAIVYDRIKKDLEEAKLMFSCPKEREEKITVQMLSDLPEFVGSDCKNYGPFSKNTITELPKKEAEILLKQNIAKLV